MSKKTCAHNYSHVQLYHSAEDNVNVSRLWLRFFAKNKTITGILTTDVIDHSHSSWSILLCITRLRPVNAPQAHKP